MLIHITPTPIWRPLPLVMTPLEFRRDLWRQKTRVPELSYDVVCVILRLAVLAHCRLVSDKQLDE